MTGPEPISRVAPALTGMAIASQRWSHLTFLHWRVESSRVAPLLPPGIVPDEHDGSSWVGLIALQLDRATLFGSPPVPYLGSFVEVNVRLYGVDKGGRRGVVFRSLEASRLAAVVAARAAFGLPYFWASTRMQREGRLVGYDATRHAGGLTTRIRARAGARIDPAPLDDFLTARWGLFTRRRGSTAFVPNEHPPWTLHSAELLDLDDELVAAAGLPGITDRPPESVLYSPGLVTRFGRG
jgi:uncharacterized protein